MLLAADEFGVAGLREACLHRLAAAFEHVTSTAAPPRDRRVFEAFVAAIAPKVLSCKLFLTLDILLDVVVHSGGE